MNPGLAREVDRLKGILANHGSKLVLSEAAEVESVTAVEGEVGIVFDKDLRDFWLLTNGSDSVTWFAVFSDQPTGCVFPPIEDARECWSWFLPYDESTYKEWSDEAAGRDARIKPEWLHHRLWFPIAEFNGYSTSVYFDADPAAEGKYGQIIVYQHDPDSIYYVAESFLDFFRQSNDLLEANADELLD